MGISLEVSGNLSPDVDLRRLIKWVEGQAFDLDWSHGAVDRSFKRATVRAGGELRPVEMVRARGLWLLPHFACERLPIIVLEPGGMLVDEIVERDGEAEPSLVAAAIVKTQFAGPDVHAEVCQFLTELKARFVPDLVVDDETGFFATRDRAALDLAFAAAWRGIWKTVSGDGLKPGDLYTVGMFPFEMPSGERALEFAALGKEEHELVLNLEGDLVRHFQGFGTRLDHSRDSVLDLELLFTDVDEQGQEKDLADPELEAFAHAAGAYLGRTLVAILGGSWRLDPEEGLLLSNVGGSGLIVNPFRIAAERLVLGPAHSITHHLATFETLLRTRAESETPTHGRA